MDNWVNIHKHSIMKNSIDQGGKVEKGLEVYLELFLAQNSCIIELLQRLVDKGQI